MGHCINKYRVRYQVDDKKDKSINVEGEEVVCWRPSHFLFAFGNIKRRGRKQKGDGMNGKQTKAK